MSSAEDVQNTNGILTLPRFQKCIGRVPSDEKIPGDMSAEDKCTVDVEPARWMRIDVTPNDEVQKTRKVKPERTRSSTIIGY